MTWNNPSPPAIGALTCAACTFMLFQSWKLESKEGRCSVYTQRDLDLGKRYSQVLDEESLVHVLSYSNNSNHKLLEMTYSPDLEPSD